MRGLKVAISGKGGVGKSTLAAALCRIFASQGQRVVAIDADPDANLASALGLPGDLKAAIHPLARETGLIEQRTGARFGQAGQMFSLLPEVSDVAEKYGLVHNGVSLLVLGAVKSGGGGCACPENVFLKKFIRHLVLREDETVVVDMEPGIEHLGRATAQGVDAMIIVLEPGTRSRETARRIIALSKDIGLADKLLFVLNKIRTVDDERALVSGEVEPTRVLGSVFYDQKFVDADCKAISIFDAPGTEEIRAEFEKIVENLSKFTNENKSS